MERSMLAYSLAHGPTLTPLIERTIGDVFDAAVEKWPAREAVVSRHERERYSYRALQVEVNRLASALLNLGLLPGDRIGICHTKIFPGLLFKQRHQKQALFS